MPTVAVIIVNWRGADDTIACLDSLGELRYQAHCVYVVDNASGDGSAAQIRAAHPEACLLEAPRNLGYAGAFNLGRAQALADGARYLWLLNNDTVVAPNALDALIQAEAEHGTGIYSPKILCTDSPDEIWYAGGYLARGLKTHHRGRGEIDHGQYDRIKPVPWATGCALFVSAEVALLLGPMDERYFLYLEDADWCLTARARGVPTYYVPAARLYHRVSRSVDRLDPRLPRYYAWRNYYFLVSRHGRWWQRILAYADLVACFAKIGIRQLLFPAYRRNSHYHARTRGLVDFVRGRLGEAPRSLSGPATTPAQVGRGARADLSSAVRSRSGQENREEADGTPASVEAAP